MTTIIFRVPPLMRDALDTVAHELRQTRSSFIREAIGHRIAYYQRHERDIVLHLRKQTDELLSFGPDDEGDRR